ncbi:NADP-dependent oxidoreductase [Mycobacterium sp. 852002-40037_SCH5390672]|uniref:NADP-dependent oxidoreductase n=1 Tax=Mycobacterium sp. 852002-40037_SCH5390672 TaxID=1834089 RepID=UPI000805E397|nr:NADP-dependent oxidoreductase [Mycobacterium sp. 852002-40037_SCH5390672]OBB95288.1 alcohol dehydrogenase [Mycobacterium sp. 852002-40037_SCH5390672]
MKAIGYTEFGGPEVLRVLELPQPHAGVGQVRVRVQAAAVNPADTAARSGWMQRTYAPDTLPGGRYPEPPYVPGWDFCGVIDESPEGAPIAVGQHVIGLTLSPIGDVGAYAEYVVTDARSVVRAPGNATAVAASTLLMNAVTAYAMLEAVAVPAGGTVAVTGAAGALGGYAVQLAKHQGLQVIADAAETDEQLVKGLGADIVVRRGDKLADHIRAALPEGVDGVVDAALYNDAIVAAIRDGGAVTSGRQHVGPTERNIVWHKVFVNQHTTRTDVLNTLRDLVEAGVLTLRVADTLPAEQAAEAHRRLEAGGLRGRLVLTW